MHQQLQMHKDDQEVAEAAMCGKKNVKHLADFRLPTPDKGPEPRIQCTHMCMHASGVSHSKTVMKTVMRSAHILARQSTLAR